MKINFSFKKNQIDFFLFFNTKFKIKCKIILSKKKMFKFLSLKFKIEKAKSRHPLSIIYGT